MTTARPRLVTLVAWWLIVTAVISWAWASVRAMQIEFEGVPWSVPWASLVLFTTVFGVQAVLGRGLLAGRRWARGSVLGLGALSLAIALISDMPPPVVGMAQYFCFVIALTAPMSGRWFRECEARRIAARDRRRRTRRLAANATRRRAHA